MNNHEIDYRIHGDDLQCVEVELDPGEAVIAEPGSMMSMNQDITMNTVFGDGSEKERTLMDKFLSAGKRVLTGEGLFMTQFTNQGTGKEHVIFAAPYPGKIIPIDLPDHDNKIICQKDAFLCAAKGVSIGIAFQKRLGTGLFGGEGFIMQSLEGDGKAFLHAGGTILERNLKPGEQLRVDTGCLVAMTRQVDYDIQYVGGIRNAIFGGEGIFFASLRGPGKVWIQSLPFSRLADKIIASAPKMGGKNKGEGSILGGLGNLFENNNL